METGDPAVILVAPLKGAGLPLRIIPRRGPHSTKRYRPVRAADLPALIAEGGVNKHLPYGMLANRWDRSPDDREAMIADPLRGTRL